MKNIIIGFSKATSDSAIFSKGIRWMQNTPFSHVYVKVFWPAANCWLIYQASGHMVNFESEKHFATHASVIKEFELKIGEESYSKIATEIINNLGKPYSLKQIAGMFLVLMAKKLGKKIENPYKNRIDAYVCCELVAGLLTCANVKINFDPEDIGPKELFDFLVENFEAINVELAN